MNYINFLRILFCLLLHFSILYPSEMENSTSNRKNLSKLFKNMKRFFTRKKKREVDSSKSKLVELTNYEENQSNRTSFSENDSNTSSTGVDSYPFLDNNFSNTRHSDPTTIELLAEKRTADVLPSFKKQGSPLRYRRFTE